MFNWQRHFGGKTLFAHALIGAAFVFSAASASAANLCVGATGADAPSCDSAYAGDSNGLTTAIADSNTAPAGADKIYLASGTYPKSGGWYLGAGNAVSLIGVGATKPVLSNANPDSYVLGGYQGAPSISNVSLVINKLSGGFGLSLVETAATVKDVDVTLGPSSNFATGIRVDNGQGNTIQRATVNFPISMGGVGIQANNASSATISGSTINALRGIELFGGSYNAVVQRSRLNSAEGVQFFNSSGTVSSSVIATPAAGTPGLTAAIGIHMKVTNGLDFGATDRPVNSFNNTIVGNGVTVQTGIISETSSAGSVAPLHVNSTAIVNDGDPLLTVQPTGVAQITASYTRYTGTPTGSNIALDPTAGPFQSDPLSGFANASVGDYALLKDSPLVDAGDPGALNGSPTDIAGNPRIASRGAGNIRDIGAYELSNGAPSAVIAVVTPTPSTTSPIAFSGSGSSDPDGDPMSFSWKFDNGQVSNGENVSRLLPTAGPHTVILTVTDSTGVAASSSAQFIVDKGAFTLALSKQAVRATGRGDFSVKLFCPDLASSNCNGKLLYQTTGKKPLKAASYVFSVEPGTTRKLPITTTKSFRKLLFKSKKVKLKSTLSGTTGNAALTAKATTFTLSAPKPKKK